MGRPLASYVNGEHDPAHLHCNDPMDRYTVHCQCSADTSGRPMCCAVYHQWTDSLNIFIVTLCVGSLHPNDWFLWLTVIFVVAWNGIVFVAFRRLKYNSNYARIATADERTLYERWRTANSSRDGVLDAVELRQFSKAI